MTARGHAAVTQSSQAAEHVDERERPRLFILKRIGLAVGTALTSINAWTGAPLLAIWVGSRFEGWVGGSGTGGGTTMRAVFVLILTLALLEGLLLLALARLSAAYDELTGRPHAHRRTSPWLRSMRGEREEFARKREGISGLERVVVVSVVAGILAFELWFFFFAGSPLPNS